MMLWLSLARLCARLPKIISLRLVPAQLDRKLCQSPWRHFSYLLFTQKIECTSEKFSQVATHFSYTRIPNGVIKVITMQDNYSILSSISLLDTQLQHACTHRLIQRRLKNAACNVRGVCDPRKFFDTKVLKLIFFTQKFFDLRYVATTCIEVFKRRVSLGFR